MKKIEELDISPMPWDCDIQEGDTVCDSVGYNVCCVDGDIKSQVRANARLIAAAPKLYEALHGLMEIVCVDCNSHYMVNGKCVKCPRVIAAEAALAEASGESEVK